MLSVNDSFDFNVQIYYFFATCLSDHCLKHGAISYNYLVLPRYAETTFHKQSTRK